MVTPANSTPPSDTTSLAYASVPPPLHRSRFGIAAVILSFFTVLPGLGILLATAGAALIAHDPDGDAGGAIILLASLAFTVVMALLFAFLWLLGVTFVCIGLARTRARCRWSRAAAIIHLVILAGGILSAVLIWNFV
jgi:hypothetical protein